MDCYKRATIVFFDAIELMRQYDIIRKNKKQEIIMQRHISIHNSILIRKPFIGKSSRSLAKSTFSLKNRFFIHGVFIKW